jgi:ribosomal protein S18 acetylase RimI-like enzyme
LSQNLPVVLSDFSYSDDLQAVLDLWQNAGDGIQLRDSDRPEEILKKIQRDPDLFLVAKVEDLLAGVVMGSFDGRRGYVYHLAVLSEFRGQGIARRLMDELERRLKSKGCLKVNLLVTNGNQSAKTFYEENGYQLMPVAAYGKVLS